MANNMNDTVVGIFLDESHAQRAIQMLKQAGFNAGISDGRNLKGLSKDQSQLFQSRANEGNVLVTVNDPSDRGEEAVNLMLDAGAENIEMQRDGSQGGSGSSQFQGRNTSQGQRDYSQYQNLGTDQRQYGRIDQATGRGRNADQIRVQLREEQLTANKQQTEAGQVEVRKVVHEKEQQIPVNLAHEEVVINRQAVDRPIAEGEIGDMKDEVIRVPVYQEEAQLQKQARVREEVTIDKEVVQEQQTLSGTTRHEHVDVQPSGDVNVQGQGNTNIRNQNDTSQYDQS